MASPPGSGTAVQDADDLKRRDLEKALHAARVLDGELSGIGKTARVYKQQPNSDVFFRTERLQIMADSKRNLERLIEEHKQAEKNTPLNLK